MTAQPCRFFTSISVEHWWRAEDRSVLDERINGQNSKLFPEIPGIREKVWFHLSLFALRCFKVFFKSAKSFFLSLETAIWARNFCRPQKCQENFSLSNEISSFWVQDTTNAFVNHLFRNLHDSVITMSSWSVDLKLHKTLIEYAHTSPHDQSCRIPNV